MVLGGVVVWWCRTLVLETQRNLYNHKLKLRQIVKIKFVGMCLQFVRYGLAGLHVQ